ncbi:MAG: type II toxin-antitoxin system HicB family antitoxin [Chloroflexota bacterium]|nr:MAG: type II toxin-antitoxin system HicB family antitoxin [Chloroflexota bacterium]
MRRYSLLLIPDPEEGGFTVRVPALPGLTTEGDTIEEAIANARDAIDLWIRSAEKHGEPIPEEGLPPQIITIDVAA